ncbi:MULTISPECIES: beta-ketoacyl-ACP synthase III [Acidithrix]|uniref:Beta-ketoacyl-[acyl-carrier-protein] synthase III n=1 Tax=Acidithrix ferrooxidans TaxID=1280514 RepID=A0A0D8HH23_9ACTN|nr:MULTISPECIES: beta-ketoacyl-ACP synthase III [Acidithrix]KJF17077.1 3-oxoacyl-[acyl-carrier-protein] synthase 3 [Acidithrix ferrooxidans]
MFYGSKIVGWGSALPDTVVTNADFEARLETNDAWITERTGIKERRFGGTTSSLAIEASQKALANAGLEPKDIDLLILSTTTPEQTIPATSATVQAELGLNCGAFDVNAACAGFVYAMVLANSMIATGVKRILVVGSDTLSRITDQEDRSTAVLFADGAGAVIMERTELQDNAFLGWDLGVDGSLVPILYCDHGGYMKMEGREVYKKAVLAMVASSKQALERAGIAASDVSLVVPHQANLRIIEAATNRLGIPIEKTAIVLDKTGNTSSGSIPLALVAAAEMGRLQNGDHVLFCGFGAGMTWAAAVIRWVV